MRIVYQKIFPVLSTLVGLWVVFTAAAFGQATGGRVTGTVFDAAGAVVPNAEVRLRNAATGHTLTTQTTGAGSYLFPNVPVGDYTVTIECASFQPMTTAAKVTLNQESTVDVTLQVAGVSGAVEVTAASEGLMQTDSSQLGRSFKTNQVLELPIFGNPNALALLSPNVVEQGAGVQGVGGAVGGTRPRGNSFNVDGVDNNDPSITGPSTKLIQDAVQEFTLLTNNYNAEFGAGAGGQFNVITKSGTNEFHGSGFYYLQHQSLNAASTLQEAQLRSGLISEKPHSQDSRYGATLGGPVIKDKLFFFGAYQRERVSQATAPTIYSAPTELGLQRIAALPGASPFVVDLLRNNLTLAPTATKTATVLGVPDIPFGDVVLGVPTSSSDNLFQVNVDHLPNAKDQFRHRFTFQRSRAEQAGGGNPKFNNLLAYDTRLFSSTWVRTLSSRMVNDLRLSYRRVTENYPLKDASASGFPNISVTALNLNLGPNLVLPQGSPVNDSYQVSDALSYVRGRHSFKFGGEFRRQIYSIRFLQLSRGFYDYADFDQLLRDEVPATNQRGVGNGSFAGNQFKFYGFGQDDWKLTPHLTLNLGLRYEYATLPRDLALQRLNAAAGVPGVIEFGVPKTDKNNFAPRLGFAYAPEMGGRVGRLLFGERGQSAIRANFGVSYYEQFYNLFLTSLPPQIQQTLDLPTSAAAFGFDPTRPFLQNGGIPGALIPITTTAAARTATQALIPDQVMPYSMAWTLSYQRELTRTTALELRYLGTRGRHLPVQLRLNGGVVNESNLVLPTFFGQPTAEQLANLTTTLGDIRKLPDANVRRLAGYGFSSNLTSYQPAGSSQYDAASVGLTHRLSRGLAFTGAYTWSKTIDDSTVEFSSSAVNPRRPQDFFNLRNERGLSALDIPHRFAASFNYELPFFNTGSRLMKMMFGGLQVNGIFQAQMGQPITVLSGRDSNLNFDSAGDRTILNLNGVPGTSSAVRAINAAGQFVSTGNAATVAYVATNPDAQYIQAGPGARATAGRNTLRTHGSNRTDANFVKNFRFGERGYNFQFGAEVNNLFNQRIRTLAGVGATTAAFATAGNQFFNDYGIGNFAGRTIQLRAKFIF